MFVMEENNECMIDGRVFNVKRNISHKQLI